LGDSLAFLSKARKFATTIKMASLSQLARRHTTRHLIEEALRLPVAERSAVIAELLASMDGAPDDDADEAWAAELERRATKAIRGESQGKDWEMVRDEIEASRRRK